MDIGEPTESTAGSTNQVAGGAELAADARRQNGPSGSMDTSAFSWSAAAEHAARVQDLHLRREPLPQQDTPYALFEGGISELSGSEGDSKSENAATKRPERSFSGLTGNQRKKAVRKEKKRQHADQKHPEKLSAKRHAHIEKSAQPAQSSAFCLEGALHTKPGYVGRKEGWAFKDGDDAQPIPERPATPEEHLRLLASLGYRIVKHDGLQDKPLKDANGRVFATHLKLPDNWGSVLEDATSALKELERDLGEKGVSRCERRGSFSAARFGYSFGGGQNKPKNIHASKNYRKSWREFVENSGVQGVMKYLAGAWQTWFPDIFSQYSKCHRELLLQDQALDLISQHCPFASVTVNFGPRAVSKAHRDAANLVYGLCALFTLGTYDHTLGGHIILHEAKLVVELKPGSILLFPSACITHENVDIGPAEERHSITWYSAGGLFRWRDQGYQSAKTLSRKSKKAKATLDAAAPSRLEQGRSQFRTVDESKKVWEGKKGRILG